MKETVPAVSDWQTLSNKVVSSTPYHEQEMTFQLLSVIGTDYVFKSKDSVWFNAIEK